MRFMVPRAASVAICPNRDMIHSWCHEMCSGLFYIRRMQTSVPSYAVFFTSRVDCRLFERAFSADMRLANDLTQV